MNYKKTYVPHNGYTPLCTIGECSLKNLEFGIIELTNGQDLTFETGDREVAFVILGGKASFRANGKDFGTLGVRRNVFENPKAECFYAPRRSTVEIHSPWNVKIAVCATGDPSSGCAGESSGRKAMGTRHQLYCGRKHQCPEANRG